MAGTGSGMTVSSSSSPASIRPMRSISAATHLQNVSYHAAKWKGKVSTTVYSTDTTDAPATTFVKKSFLLSCLSGITHSRIAFLAALWQISVMSAPEYPCVALASMSMLTSSATGDCSGRQQGNNVPQQKRLLKINN